MQFKFPFFTKKSQATENISNTDVRIFNEIYQAVQEKVNRFKNDVQNPYKLNTLTQNALQAYYGVNNSVGAHAKEISVTNQYFGGLQNPSAGTGGANDPFSYSYRCDVPYLSYQILDVYYRTNWMAARGIDLPADDMTRKWREFEHDDPKVLEARKEAEKQYNVAEVVNEAVKWANLYGGSAVVFSLKGESEKDFANPLNLKKIRKGDLEFMHVVIKDQSNPMSAMQLDPFHINYLKPTQYYVATVSGASTVHSSRLVIFYGRKLPIYSALRQLMWGDSKLAPLLGLIDITEALWQNTGGLVSKANVDVIQLESYLQTLSKAPDQLWNRLGFNKKIISNYNTLLLDAKDKFERNELSNLTGLSDVLLSFLQMIAGSFGIPLTKYLGTSVGGFSSGDNEIIEYYDSIHERQNKLRPQLLQIDRIIEMSVFGELKDLNYEFTSLIEMTAVQKAGVDLQNAQTDQIYLDMGVVSEYDVAARLQDEGTYPTIDQEHLDKLNDDPTATDIDDMMGDDLPLGSGEGATDEKPSDAIEDIT